MDFETLRLAFWIALAVATLALVAVVILIDRLANARARQCRCDPRPPPRRTIFAPPPPTDRNNVRSV